MESTYTTNEVNPQEIFKKMKSDFYKMNPYEFPLINKEYFKRRNNLINFNHKISKKLGFKSQTFFLSIYYLDLIFLQNKNLLIPNFFLLSISCLIVAAKYCENDPNVPPLQTFIKIYNKYNIHSIGMKELLKMEVKILKYLNYNIHYITVYDFNLFFFNHGIIKKQQIKDILNNNTNYNKNMGNNNKSDISSNEELDFVFDDGFYIKKILEKIYKKSRYFLDLIISNENICFKYDSLLISICIMKKSIEEVILKEYKLKYKDFFLNKRQIMKKNNEYFKEIMNDFYKIDFESYDKYNEFIRDNNVINIFLRQEKEKKDLNNKNKKEKLKNNLYNFIKVSNYNNINEKKSNNNNYNFNIKNKSVINLNNSMEQPKEKVIKPNLTLFHNYTIKNNNQKENGKNEINSNSFVENKRNRYTFIQLKNNLKKDLSLRKKRCSDNFRINNLKSLCKLTSCANTIQNIKEININSDEDNNNIYFIKNNSKENKKFFSKEKNQSQSNNIINIFKAKNKLYPSLDKKKELKLENIESNKMKYNKVIITDNFHSKEKNKIKNNKILIDQEHFDTNRKPYFKKVIHNYEPMNKKIINKNNIKINIYNILNTSNDINEINEIEKKKNFLTINNDNNYYSTRKQNKFEIMQKRMDEINKINKIKKMYNFKKLDINIKNKLNKNNINNSGEKKVINISPKSISKSKEINYINIINNTNDNEINMIQNKVSTLDNQSSYFKKKIFNSLNKNNKKINNNVLLTTAKIDNNNDNRINNNDINDIIKQKYHFQFHSKLFSTLTNNK